MSDFDYAINVVLKHECPSPILPVGGGYVNDPNDLGGATCYGISTLIVKRENITAEALKIPDLSPESFKLMTLETAKHIYKKIIWDRNHYCHISDKIVATKIFDISVNCGPSRAGKIVQQALCEIGNPVKIDGILGEKSFTAINECPPNALMDIICRLQKEYYEYITLKRPQNKKFLKGWLKRASWRG